MQTHRSFITNSRIRYTFESLILSNINSTRLTTSCDIAYQLLAHGRWFSSGTPTSSTTKTGRHDISEILCDIMDTVNDSSGHFEAP